MTGICILLFILFITALIYLYLLKKDVRQLKGKLKEISEIETNGRLTTTTFDKDVTDLANDVNGLLDKHKITLVQKNQAEADLKRAITNISHDLRTPLTSAIGYLQMLEEDMLHLNTLDSDTRLRYVKIMKNRLESLSVLMNNLFEFTRVVEGNVKLVRKKINVCSILRDVLSSCYPEFMKKGFTVDAGIPDAPYYAYLDETAFRRVLQNIVKNVYEHGMEYMKIWMGEGSVHIANKVNDLPSMDVEQIFERFYTSDASRTHKNTGLGLAIAKELTVRMGVGITANKEEDWLVVTLTLPMEKSQYPDRA